MVDKSDGVAHYYFMSDPAHGWLQVPLSLVRELESQGAEFSQFSFKDRAGEWAYLEEDSDMPKFMDLLGVRHGDLERITVQRFDRTLPRLVSDAELHRREMASLDDPNAVLQAPEISEALPLDLFAGPFKVLVVADSGGKFSGNGLLFDTIKEAEQYAVDLASRWTLVLAWAVVPGDFSGSELDKVKAVSLASSVMAGRLLS